MLPGILQVSLWADLTPWSCFLGYTFSKPPFQALALDKYSQIEVWLSQTQVTQLHVTFQQHHMCQVLGGKEMWLLMRKHENAEVHASSCL